MRDAINRLSILSTDGLSTEPEWRRAYVMLAYMTHAYIWAGDNPEEVLPPQITIPFQAVSAHVELPPVLTYTAASLWNFSCSGEDFSEPEDLSTLFTFTETESKSWFLLISVAMEAKASGIIQTIVGATEAIKTRNYNVISDTLQDIKSYIKSAGMLLERMYEKCDPMIFYHRVRPFLAGSKNMGAAGLPRGVFYDEGEGKGQWRQLQGGSNGQSCLIQLLDVVLGIEHNSNCAADQKSFHYEARDYMPGPHRRFLLHVAEACNIRKLAMLPEGEVASAEHQRLRSSYLAAADQLCEFRSIHIQIVTRYIMLPSKKPLKGESRRKLASPVSYRMENAANDAMIRTGGTRLISFLKETRVETFNAKKLDERVSQ
ncbi:Indoleamine 2,3-dioxygenase [Trichoderma lentiforme]|uniref:Indoleamine 2,3-dioxygenase n=1 Tax=Trichoderma lentiforme TaxID=1567552 RepID=A0A9P4XPI9_9HYPO|nr:Indoleamine 2,3-dioxygenase [Trichoderma lentiforme]